MRALLFGASMAVVSAVALGAAVQQQFPAPPTPQHPIFRAGATLVAVDVYPTKSGKVVEDLKPSDFEVKEDGKPQTVEFFEFLKFETNPTDAERRDPATAEEGERLAADPHHRAFVAYFDTYHLKTWGARQMRTPVLDFLDRTIGSTDYFAAMNPDVPAGRLTFGQRQETIASEIEEYWPLATAVDAGTIPLSAREKFLQACYQNRSGLVSVDDLIVSDLYRRWRTDLVLKSLIDLVTKLATVREERTSVLLFSDGWSFEGPDPTLEFALWHAPFNPTLIGGQLGPSRSPTSGVPPGAQACDAELARLAEIDFHDDFRRLTDDALRKNVAFYPIEPAGLEAFGDDLTSAANPPSWNAVNNSLGVLTSLAASTNGLSIVRTNNIGTPLEQLSTALSSYYLLGYYTTNAKLDGRYRTIDVAVKQPGLKVTARHGYVASPNPVVTTTVSAGVDATAEKTALGALAHLDEPEPVMAAGIASGADLAVVAEVTGAQTSAIAAGADVTVTVTNAVGAAPVTATGRIDKGATSGLVRVPIGTTAGPWDVRVVVGAPGDGLSATLRVAPPVAGLVSEPLLYRATPSPRSPLWPSASHRFTRNDRLHLEWTTNGPLDSHVGRLLDSRGQPLAVGVSLTEPPDAARPTLAGDVSLAPLAPGDYLVELVVGKDGTTERHLVAIRIGT